MRVGIITFHCSYNYGSVLQAYALQKAVRDLTGDVKIIDYRSRDFDQYRIIHLFRPWKIPKSLLNLDVLVKRKKAFSIFSERYLCLTENRYSYHSERKLLDLQGCFDAFICGSDQIWNLDCTKGVVEPFFLSFAGDKRRIAYAPSLAHTSFRPENYDKGKIADLLSRFAFLSVREEETLPLFQPLVNKKIEVVLDPTLLLGADSYRGMVGAPVQEEPYIFVYLLRDCPELIESAVEMSKGSGMRAYYISESDLPIPGAVNLFGAGPEEFVSLIAHAGTVLTNSFHATVFSILFHRSFRVFATDLSASRMRGLLEGLGISERCADATDASQIAPTDWCAVESRLDGLRADSWAYLREALA